MRIYTNEEQTRTFIGIVVTAGQETLTPIARRLDTVLADFKLPPFYEVKSDYDSVLVLGVEKQILIVRAKEVTNIGLLTFRKLHFT